MAGPTGRTVAIQYPWAEGRAERSAELAAELARLKVHVIVTGGNAALAAKQASSAVPVVFALVDDPVGMGLVATLARPGGNVTGLATQGTDVASKRLALLREVVPGLRRLAIMANMEYLAGVREMGAVQSAARTLGLDPVAVEIRRAAEDIAPPWSRRNRRVRHRRAAAAGDSVLGLDLDWSARVAEVAPHFVAHSSTKFVRQGCQCLAGGSAAAFKRAVIRVE